MNQRYILTILSRRRGKNHTNELYFRGSYEQAREAAEHYRQTCIKAGGTDVRVEIWQVIATSYKGTVRGAAR
ncbi:MAG: hypothetical protein IIY54_01465 [Ruminococcus sp.]|nr:hypothetical protein [Ruminococcus sp.]